MEQTPEQIAQSALDAFGKERQIDKCIEELGELATVLMKFRHGEVGADAVIDELADVAVTGSTLCVLFGREAVDARVKVKLRRLVRLVADQAQAKVQENPFRELVQEPKPGETKCGACMWWGAQGQRDAAGVCMHKDRASRDRGYMAAADCSLPKPEPKPKPARCWSPWCGGYNLQTTGRWLGFVQPRDAMWTTDLGKGDLKWYPTMQEAMRAVELHHGLDEVPLWTP